eukprot:284815042_6
MIVQAHHQAALSHSGSLLGLNLRWSLLQFQVNTPYPNCPACHNHLQRKRPEGPYVIASLPNITRCVYFPDVGKTETGVGIHQAGGAHFQHDEASSSRHTRQEINQKSVKRELKAVRRGTDEIKCNCCGTRVFHTRFRPGNNQGLLRKLTPRLEMQFDTQFQIARRRLLGQTRRVLEKHGNQGGPYTTPAQVKMALNQVFSSGASPSKISIEHTRERITVVSLQDCPPTSWQGVKTRCFIL